MGKDKAETARKIWLAKLAYRLQGDRKQYQFADLLGTSQQTIGNMTGRDENEGVIASTDPRNMNVEFWLAFAEMEGTTVEALYQSMLEASTQEGETPNPKQIDRGLLRRLVSASTSTKLAALQLVSSFFAKENAIASVAQIAEDLEQENQRSPKDLLKMISDIALSLSVTVCDNNHVHCTEIVMVQDSVIAEFRRSLNEAIARLGLDELAALTELEGQYVLALSSGSLPPTTGDLQVLAGILLKESGEAYEDTDLMRLFNIPKKAYLATGH